MSAEDEQRQMIELDALAKDFEEFFAHLEHRLPDGREKSLVITKLQEAAMWAQVALTGGQTDGD
jgi:hypothetical protein